MVTARQLCSGALLLAIASTTFASDIPKGMDDVYNIKSEKRFHPFWPPIFGQSLLGTIVDAKNPGKPEAIFETIESPTYRSVGYTEPFAFTSYAVPGGDWSKTKTFGADVAFSQLDAMATGVRSGAKTASLTGNDTTVASRTDCADTTASSGSSNPGTAQSGNSAKDSTSGQTSSTGQKSNQQTGCPDRTVTGVDFGRFTQANVTISKLTVLYYTREMLLKMRDKGPNGALSREGQQAISKDENGWIISRCLVADSITYDLTSNTAIDGGFFAKLLAWLPTANLRYKNDHTISIKTTSPVVLGYKLWRLDVPLTSQSVTNPDYSMDADKIDAILAAGKQ